MSEYTTIYLRNKATPLLEYKEHPSWNEFKDLSDDEINKIEEERKEHNRKVERSMGCELFYLTTTPSRELAVLPWSPSPKVLTKELIEGSGSYSRYNYPDGSLAFALTTDCEILIL